MKKILNQNNYQVSVLINVSYHNIEEIKKFIIDEQTPLFLILKNLIVDLNGF